MLLHRDGDLLFLRLDSIKGKSQGPRISLGQDLPRIKHYQAFPPSSPFGNNSCDAFQSDIGLGGQHLSSCFRCDFVSHHQDQLDQEDYHHQSSHLDHCCCRWQCLFRDRLRQCLRGSGIMYGHHAQQHRGAWRRHPRPDWAQDWHHCDLRWQDYLRLC